MSNTNFPDIDPSHLSLSHLSTDPAHPYSSWPSLPPHPAGRCTLLTPSVVTEAAKEIQTGKRFSLDYAVYPSERALYGRLKAVHTVLFNGDEAKDQVEAKRKAGDMSISRRS